MTTCNFNLRSFCNWLTALVFVVTVQLNSPEAHSASRTIAYQGFLTDAAGVPLNGDFDLTFRIYRDVSGSRRLWSERHLQVSVRAGLYLVALGSVEPLENVPELYEVGRTFFVSIEVGEDGEMVPRLPLGAAPYALASGGAPQNSATTVDCTRGETIAEALSNAPAAGEYTINITGTCEENIQIERNHLTLVGDGTAKILGVTPNPHPGNAVVYVSASAIIGFRGLTIEGAAGDATEMRGILVDDGSAAIMFEDVLVHKVNGVGVHILDNSTFDVRGQVRGHR